MSENKPVTFTEEEQLKLVELEKSVQGFANWKNIVSRSLYAGQDSQHVAALINFLTDMAVQAAQQVEQIQASAKARGSEKKEEKKESKKKDS